MAVIVTCALAYAQLGLCVFPVAANCRTPLTAHGYKDATADPGEIERLWRQHPKANIAVATGHRSGAFVLDVDVKGANGLRTVANLEAAHGPLPAAPRTITPSGGRHLWFRRPARAMRNRVGFLPGLDVRTDGGSVAVPPSRRADGLYKWEIAPWDRPLADAPEWLLNFIDPPPVPRPPSPTFHAGSIDRLARYVHAAIAAECTKLAGMAPNSGRNLQLFKAAANLGGFVGAGAVPASLIEECLEAAAAACGLIREDGRHAVAATIKSGLHRGAANPRDVAL